MEHTTNTEMTHSIGRTKVFSGYTLFVPHTFDKKHIPQSSTQEFM